MTRKICNVEANAHPLVTLAAIALVLVSYRGAASPWLYVLDDEQRTVSAVNYEGEVEWTVEVGGAPVRMTMSPNGDYLVIFHRGLGIESKRFGWVPESKSALQIVDTGTQQVATLPRACWSPSTGTIERGQGIGGGWLFSSSEDRLVILCEGRWARLKQGVIQKMRKPDLPEMLEIQLGSATITAQRTLDRRVVGWFSLPDSNGFAVFLRADSRAEKSAALIFVDGRSLDTQTIIEVDGDPRRSFMSADKSLIYVFDSGGSARGADKNSHGALHVISTIDRRLVNEIDLGTAPKMGVDIENARLIFMSSRGRTAERKSRNIKIARIVENGQLLFRADTGHESQGVWLFPERSRLYSADTKSFRIIDTATSESKEIRFPKKFQSIGPLLVNGDHTKAYLLAVRNPNRGYTFNAIHLDEMTAEKPVPIGSWGKSMGKTLAVAAVASYGVGAMMPSTSSLGMSFDQVMQQAMQDALLESVLQELAVSVATNLTRGGIYGGLMFGPQNRYVYAINDASRDVTIFDTTMPGQHKIIQGSGGAEHIRLIPDKRRLAVLADEEKLLLIDTNEHVVVEKWDFGGNYVPIKGGEYMIAVSSKNRSVYRLNPKDLRIETQVEGFKHPRQFVLASIQ